MSESTIEKLMSWAGVAVIILIGILVILIVAALVKRALKRSKLDPMLYTFILNAVKIILILILIIVTLESLGIGTAPFVAVMGVTGGAIALALKDSLGNIAGGVMIMFTKPFRQGDYVDIDGTMGIIKIIDLLTTTMETFDNKVIIIPNGMITTSIITNYTLRDTRRVDLLFGIGYDEDINKAKELMLSVADACPLIMAEPVPFIGVAGNQDNGVNLNFWVWCHTQDYWTVKFFLEENVKIAFDEAGISLPFPQMDVHLKK